VLFKRGPGNFKCWACDKEKKKRHGCVRPTPKKKPVWYIDECFVCWGKNPKCKTCHGTNRILMYRCPHALARDSSVVRLLPHLTRYRKYGVYPDGTMAMLKQPIALLHAITVAEYFWNKYEMEQIKNGGSS